MPHTHTHNSPSTPDHRIISCGKMLCKHYCNKLDKDYAHILIVWANINFTKYYSVLFVIARVAYMRFICAHYLANSSPINAISIAIDDYWIFKHTHIVAKWLDQHSTSIDTEYSFTDSRTTIQILIHTRTLKWWRAIIPFNGRNRK